MRSLTLTNRTKLVEGLLMSVADVGSIPTDSTMGSPGLDVVGRDKLASKRAFSLKIAKNNKRKQHSVFRLRT